jgi:hypothetical protein
MDREQVRQFITSNTYDFFMLEIFKILSSGCFEIRNKLLLTVVTLVGYRTLEPSLLV